MAGRCSWRSIRSGSSAWCRNLAIIDWKGKSRSSSSARQAMDEDHNEDRKPLLDRLSPEARNLPPVGYRFLHASPTSAATLLRLAESRHYRANGYVSLRFRKPISKCCGQDDV